jgi:maleylpyruvate isomerase
LILPRFVPSCAAFDGLAPVNRQSSWVDIAMKLYTYFRSSAAYRVRIALNIKGVGYESVPVHLLRNGGEQHAQSYRRLNPQGLVPTLIDDSAVLQQSLAIIEYLDELFPQPPLLPRHATGRAHVRAMTLLIACEIHPLNNLQVLEYLRTDLAQSETAIDAWCGHWIHRGFAALEQLVATHSSSEHHCYGDTVSMADVCLVPQMANARRRKIALNAYPRLMAIDQYLRALPEFERAAPEHQPDA